MLNEQRLMLWFDSRKEIWEAVLVATLPQLSTACRRTAADEEPM